MIERLSLRPRGCVGISPVIQDRLDLGARYFQVGRILAMNYPQYPVFCALVAQCTQTPTTTGTHGGIEGKFTVICVYMPKRCVGVF